MAGAELLLHFNFAHLPFMANTGLSINHKSRMRCFKTQIRSSKYQNLQDQVQQLQLISLCVNYFAYLKYVVIIVGLHC